MPIIPPPSAINNLALDTPLVQDATYELTDQDRAYIDSQTVGVERHLVQSLITGTTCTWAQLYSGSAAAPIGTAVCLAGQPSQNLALVTLATAGALAAAGSVFGVVVQSAAPGGNIRVCLAGALSPTITGLSAGAALYCKVAGAGVLTPEASTSPGDYIVGTIDAAGNLNVFQALPQAAGGGVTIPAITTSHRVSNAGFTFADSTYEATLYERALAGTVTVNLDAAPTDGMIRYVADEDGTITGGHSIIVSGNGHNIDGQASMTMNVANGFGAVTGFFGTAGFKYNGGATAWKRI